uniref:Uncharacterized protein n=1 Tax=Riptortus pedestris TaxID=329032 RepID=R4WI54_RIPPE|nr:unknown secreted protein [Riptortus pedestris]
MALLLAVISIFLVSAQGLEEPLSFLATMDQGSLQKQHEGLVADVKDWFVGTMKDMKNDVDSQVEHLKNVMDTSNKEGEQKIHQLYENSLLKLRKLNAPEECISQGEKQLLQSKEVVHHSFLQCSNMTRAVEDGVELTYTAGGLIADLLLSADDILNGFNKCWSWNPITFISCTWTWTRTAFSDVTKTFGELKSFTGKVVDIVSDIQTQVSYCWNKGADTFLDHMTNTLADIHECKFKTQSKK